MEIKFRLHGDEIISLEIPENTKFIEFDLTVKENEIYDSTLHCKTPTIKSIEFYKND